MQVHNLRIQVLNNLEKAMRECATQLSNIKAGFLGVVGVVPKGAIFPKNTPVEKLLRARAADIWLGQVTHQEFS